MGFAIFFIFLIAIIAFVVLGIMQAERRRKELGQWAASRGFSFSPDHDSSMDNRHPHFDCLHEGDDRYAYNVMRGRAGKYSVCAFDYHYETSSTDSKGNRSTTSHYFSAVIVDTHLPLRPLAIRGETFLDRVGEFFGFDDIDFESAEFSRAFRVTSPDRRWAFDVLHQESMEFLLGAPRFALEIHGGRVIAHNGRVFDPRDFDAALGVAVGLIDRIPDGVINDLQGIDA